MKTTKTGASVKEFLDGIAEETKRADANALDRLIRKATGLGFSPRSDALTA